MNIIKIHNNKPHSTTKRIPFEFRDLVDNNEIQEIKNNIKETLSKKNKLIETFDLKDFYVLDYNNIKVYKNKISEKYKKGKKKLIITNLKFQLKLLKL